MVLGGLYRYRSSVSCCGLWHTFSWDNALGMVEYLLLEVVLGRKCEFLASNRHEYLLRFHTYVKNPPNGHLPEFFFEKIFK